MHHSSNIRRCVVLKNKVLSKINKGCFLRNTADIQGGYWRCDLARPIPKPPLYMQWKCQLCVRRFTRRTLYRRESEPCNVAADKSVVSPVSCVKERAFSNLLLQSAHFIIQYCVLESTLIHCTALECAVYNPVCVCNF